MYVGRFLCTNVYARVHCACVWKRRQGLVYIDQRVSTFVRIISVSFLNPGAAVNAAAIAVMKEVGIDIAPHLPKAIDDAIATLGEPCNVMLTVMCK